MNVSKPRRDELLPILESLLSNKNGESALMLLRRPESRLRIFGECALLIASVMKELHEDNFRVHPFFYRDCEDLLKVIAMEADVGEVILELLEVVDVTRSDNTMISVLKAMQVCLLRADHDGQHRALEWCLNSVQSYVCELPLAPELRYRLDSSETHVEDEHEQIRRIVSFYYFMFLFYEPVLEQIIQYDGCLLDESGLFRDGGLTRRNILLSFIIQLFAEPLSYFDTSVPLNRTHIGPAQMNIYIQDCTNQLSRHFVRLMRNPMHLIGQGERRHRWPYILPCIDETVCSQATQDMFVIEEKAPFTALAVMFYVFLAARRMPADAPKIYRSTYIFEMGLYYANELISKPDESYRTKGLRLAIKLLDNLRSEDLGDETLELDIHRQFSTNLMIVLDTTRVRKNSKASVELFQKYIQKFRSPEAKFYHIRHLFTVTDNKKIHGFLIVMYKNLIAAQLNLVERQRKTDLPDCCRGEMLRYILRTYALTLPDGTETDLLKNSDIIVAALNVLRFLVIRDMFDFTQVWEDIDFYEREFIRPLRDALEMTRTQYQMEELRIKEEKAQKAATEVEVNGEKFGEMCAANRLQALNIARNTLDLIESLLLRVLECVEQRLRKDLAE